MTAERATGPAASATNLSPMATAVPPASSPAPAPESFPMRGRPLPWLTQVEMFFRLLGVQASWNYEVLLGTGIGFCVEPALRLLPGGKGGPAYRAAVARQSQYFNAHPYLASVAVGALARAELDGEAPERIERFRTALCGPLGSVGDRLVWAAWLPFCSLVALLAVGLGAGPWTTVTLFVLLYNAGHVALRAWGLHAGLTRGMKVAQALGGPVLRFGPQWIGQAAAFVGGAALPLALTQLIGPGRALLGVVMGAVVVGAVVITQLHGRVEGRRIALLVLAAFVLYSLAR
jgi:PTS system mannose-specific IID component